MTINKTNIKTYTEKYNNFDVYDRFDDHEIKINMIGKEEYEAIILLHSSRTDPEDRYQWTHYINDLTFEVKSLKKFRKMYDDYLDPDPSNKEDCLLFEAAKPKNCDY